MKKNLILFSLSLLLSGTPASYINSQSFDLIPCPVSQKSIDNLGVKAVQLDSDSEKILSSYLDWVKTWPIQVKLNSSNPNTQFLLNKDIAAEGYDLKITSNQVILSYSNNEGLRNGLSSLLQL